MTIENKPNEHHIMLDIETDGTKPGCRILSLGAVEIAAGLIMQITLPMESVDHIILSTFEEFTFQEFHTISNPSTLVWWDTQDPVQRERQFNNPNAVSESVMLWRFQTWWDQHCSYENTRVWTKGPLFDISILEHAFAFNHMPIPWKYSNIRDLRTLQCLAETYGKGKHAPHGALQDCILQVEQLVGAVQALKEY